LSWAKKYRRTGGTIMMRFAAIKRFNAGSPEVTRLATPIATVNFSLLSR
jgi:hypothetical protein